MKYPKKIMTIKELTETDNPDPELNIGYPDEWLREIYRSRSINRNHKIAWKMGGEDKPHSTILFDTDELEKYRRSQCTGK